MKPRSLVQGALGLCTAALIAGCSQSPGTPAAQAYRPAYILQVPVTAQDTRQELEGRYGGKVVELNTQEGYAVVGLDQAAAKTQNLRAQALGAGPVAEPNLNQFQGGALALMAGARSIWAGGEWQAWAGGARSIWAGGTYMPVLQNSGAFQQIKLENAQKLAPNLGAGVKVAVIDTGIDLSHPAFAGALAPSTEWKDFYGNDNLPQEEGILGVGGYGHGTAVASIILQVAPKATILPLRVLGPNGEGDTLQVANAIKYAVAQKARVINLSLGSTTKSDAVQSAIQAATTAGVLVVSSAGNDNTPTITYPAVTADDKGPLGERSLSVGSVNSLDRKSSFSNYSPDLELSAPGENIFTAGPGNLLVAWSGTSMAAPMASGGLALALSQTLAVDIKDVTRKMAENGFDLYSSGLNSAYKDKLGKRRLDLELFLKSTIRY